MVFYQRGFPFRTTFYFLEHTVFNVLQTFQTDWVDLSTQYILAIHKYCSVGYPLSCHPSCASVISQLSSHTIIYFILGFKLFLPTLLVTMSANFRPSSHQTILCILKFLPFLKKYTLLEMRLIYLEYHFKPSLWICIDK